ncbi:MAG: ribbon-helix-helix protein, CopG family [Verrucomicrobia bacterium]|nr:ribbon-helix-helix protein, CopG family [Verrucomicrobiota bacterium]
MKNLTMRVDEEVLKKARKLAIDRDTTVTQMIREFLEQLAAEEQAQHQWMVRELKDSFTRYSVNVGARKWSRDDLHER